MSPMNSQNKAIDDFWRWFQAHRADFDALIYPETPFWDVALERLQRLDERLWFELSEPDGDSREFIVTAEGHQEVFPLADAIVARAPDLPGWRFIALKPPMGFDFQTNYEGVEFDPRDMWFLPLNSRSRPENLGLRIGVPNYADAEHGHVENAVLVILDTAIGERSAALDIHHLEVAPLPESPESEGYIELPELPRFIEWRKGRNSKA